MLKPYIPFLISILIGFFLINVIFRKERRLPPLLQIFLGAGLGLGISSIFTFSSYVIFNRLIENFVIILNTSFLVFLILLSIIYLIKDKKTSIEWNGFKVAPILTIGLLCIAMIPLWYQAHFYVHGGWDAWSTWNLKARFLYLGGIHWQNILDPALWRSSPHYPLLLPLINVWGWHFVGNVTHLVPITTALIFTTSTVGLLFTSLRYFTKSYFPALTFLILLTSPFYVKNAFSQYCDIVVSFYMLAGLFCLLVAKKENSSSYSILAGLMIGLLTFTKPEATLAAMMITGLSIPYFLLNNTSKHKKRLLIIFLITTAIATIPSAIFYLLYSPGNQSFINGFTSTIKPSNFYRLKIIFGFYFLELISPQWNGLWLILFAAMGLLKKTGYKKDIIIIPAFLGIYAFVLTFYYQINTYFKIDWWLQVTLSRMLFAILPLVIFWCFYSLWQEKS